MSTKLKLSKLIYLKSLKNKNFLLRKNEGGGIFQVLDSKLEMKVNFKT